MAVTAAQPRGSIFAESEHRSEFSRAWRRFSANRIAVVGLVMVAILILMAVFAPLIAPYDPIEDIFRGHARRPSLARTSHGL